MNQSYWNNQKIYQYRKKIAAKKNIIDTQSILKFKDQSLLDEALTHSTYIEELKQDRQTRFTNILNKFNETKRSNSPKDYQRLEYLGDSMLGFVLADYLFIRFPDCKEKELTQMRTLMVNQQSLALMAEKLQLGSQLKLGVGGKLQKHQLNESTLCDIFESYIGAVFKDRGFEFGKEYIIQLFEEYFDFDVLSKDQTFKQFNPIGALLEHLQNQYKETVVLEEILKQKGPAHDKQFQIKLKYKGVFLGEGIGKTKKNAKQNAALQACEKLKINM